jgi:thiamine pyrophosphokinase
MTYKKAVIFLNGYKPDPKVIAGLIDKYTYIIGCDGGTEHIRSMRYKPNLILGDLDSISEETMKAYSQIELICFNADKDYTDSELSIDHAMSLGIKEIIIVGMLGDRIDHVLGNLFLFAKQKYKNLNLKAIDKNQEVYVVRSHAVIEGRIGDTVSLMPLAGVAVITECTGVRYDLSKATMSQQCNSGVSNVFTANRALITISRGLLLVVHQFKIQ